MKKKLLENRLKELGFRKKREGGNHEIWSNGMDAIAMPRHREIREGTAKAILKQAKLASSHI